MLDTKRILQLGIGVAVGMIAWHFIQKAMNNGEGKSGASGCKTIGCHDLSQDPAQHWSCTSCNGQNCCWSASKANQTRKRK